MRLIAKISNLHNQKINNRNTISTKIYRILNLANYQKLDRVEYLLLVLVNDFPGIFLKWNNKKIVESVKELSKH